MAFHLTLSESVQTGFRRVALQQIEAGLRAADDPRAQDAAPHEIRKRCKKLRGLLRLVRGSFGDYRVEQRTLRDAARKLSLVRDASAHLEALERLCRRDPARYQGPDFAQARAWLQEQRETALRASALHDCIREAQAMLLAQRERISGWTLRERGFDAAEPGLVGTYRTARRALSDACDQPTAHRLHELRKQVKYHRFHLGLLHKLWPRPMTAAVDEAEALGQVLGKHHDIDVLLAALMQRDAGQGEADAARRLALAMRPERLRLEQAALCSARRLLAERPRCFGERLRGYWRTARR